MPERWEPDGCDALISIGPCAEPSVQLARRSLDEIVDRVRSRTDDPGMRGLLRSARATRHLDFDLMTRAQQRAFIQLLSDDAKFGNVEFEILLLLPDFEPKSGRSVDDLLAAGAAARWTQAQRAVVLALRGRVLFDPGDPDDPWDDAWEDHAWNWLGIDGVRVLLLWRNGPVVFLEDRCAHLAQLLGDCGVQVIRVKTFETAELRAEPAVIRRFTRVSVEEELRWRCFSAADLASTWS